MNTTSIFTLAAVASLIAGAASAQDRFNNAGGTAFSNTGLIGDSAVRDANEDLSDDIEDDYDRQTLRFGNEGREQGFVGSVSLRATAGNGSRADGSDDTVDLGFGANMGYGLGANGFDLGLYYAYSEDDGDTTQDYLLYDLQYTRDFTPQIYGFALLQGSYQGNTDDSDDDALDESFERENDVFLGFGAGYRIINTPDQQWAVQAGPGYRFASFRDIGSIVTDLNGDDSDDINEAAFSLSSDYSQRINETVFFTNDTDIITSSADTVLYNDLGFNIAMSNALALRTSLQSEYHTDPADGDRSTEHLFGVSLVYSFN